MGASSNIEQHRNKVIWIDAHVDNKENSSYINSLRININIDLKLCKNVDEAINYIKNIKFEETKIILSGRVYSEFVEKFKQNISNMFFIPKIIIFTINKDRFIEYNPEYIEDDNKFYRYGGIATHFNMIKKFIFYKDKQNKEQIFCERLRNSNVPEKIKLSFEFIDNKEKLMLPLFFKSLIDITPKDNMDEYTKYLYNTYAKEDNNLKKLLMPIESMKNIPIEILSKYYIRLYSAKLKFYHDINKALEANQIEKHLPFIKVLYEGLKLMGLPLANDFTLYKVIKFSYKEIFIIKGYLEHKFKDLPGAITFSKSFMFFTKDKYYAEEQLMNLKNDKNYSKVLFILEGNYDNNYKLSTHCDIENISFFPGDREVLFFPFSSFEIKDIKEININNDKVYEIDLLYLGGYLNSIENDNNLITNKIRLLDSAFKKQLSESGIIQKEIILNLNNKSLYYSFKKDKNDIYEIIINKENAIIGEINIESYDKHKNIQIINSFENVKNLYKKENAYDDYKYINEKEIKENIEIRIDGKPIEFSYSYKFQNEGKHIIKYLFKNKVQRINHMFYKCNNIIKLDLSNFHSDNITNMSHMFHGDKYLKYIKLENLKTQNVTNMSEMFKDCKSLTSLNLSSFDTQNVTDMSFMFYECNKLTNINLSNLNTQNVKDMRFMFYGCIKLVKLDLSNFNTQNVLDMSEMFNGCKCLKNLDLSNFDTKNALFMISMFYDCNSLKKENIITKDERILKKLGH